MRVLIWIVLIGYVLYRWSDWVGASDAAALQRIDLERCHQIGADWVPVGDGVCAKGSGRKH